MYILYFVIFSTFENILSSFSQRLTFYASVFGEGNEHDDYNDDDVQCTNLAFGSDDFIIFYNDNIKKQQNKCHFLIYHSL